MGRLSHDSGATMVEYAIMVAVIALVTIVIVEALGISVLGWFTEIGDAF